MYESASNWYQQPGEFSLPQLLFRYLHQPWSTAIVICLLNPRLVDFNFKCLQSNNRK